MSTHTCMICFALSKPNNCLREEHTTKKHCYLILMLPTFIQMLLAVCLHTFYMARAQSYANHVQHIQRLSRASVMLRATWYEGAAQLLSLTELKSHLFELYFIGWTIKPMKEGRKSEYLEKTPGDEVQKMLQTTARKFKLQARLEPAQKRWWQVRKADMLTVTPRVALPFQPVFL